MRSLANLIVYAVAYTAAVRLGYAFRSFGDGASPFWPAAGLSLAALLLTPTRRWPAYVLVGMLGSALVKRSVEGAPVLELVKSAPFDMVESLVGASLLRARTDFDPALPRVRDLLQLAFVSFFIAAPTAALLGAWRLVQETPSLSYFTVAQTWSLGDALGILLFAPPVLATVQRREALHARRELLERVAFIVVAAAVGVLGLGGLAFVNPGLAAYLAAPVMCFAAFRYGLRVTSYVAVFLSTTAVVTSHATSSLARSALTDVASLQIFGFVAVAMVLLAAAIDEQRARTEAHLRVERSLRTAQKFEALGRLSSGVAHDFNAVLATIMASAELIKLTEDTRRIHRLADDVIDAAARGGEVVKQLLHYGRGDMTTPVACPLAPMLREEAKALERMLRVPGAIRLRIDDEALVVTTDATALRRVLLNLVRNAADASGDSPRITLGLRAHTVPTDGFDELRPQTPLPPSLASGTYACLFVADEGHGMTEDVLLCAFEPFFTTKGEGTGLGLASAYAYVTAASGAIVAASAPSRGTTVRLLLPLRLTSSV